VDVALGLVLNEIAHQARSIANAAGAAVLLIRGGVPVSRSTSGATAREASAYLSEYSGLAWRDGAPQNCHDVETDSRVDLASFRRLGIRSFLIVPVQDDKKTVVAIIQTFAARPQAGNDRDLLALQGLGRHIVDHLDAAERIFAPIPKIVAKANPQIAPGKKTLSPFVQWFNTAKLTIWAEPLNLTLRLLIVILAIFLGWTIGSSERESARRNRERSLAAVVNHPQITVTPSESNSASLVQVANQTTPPASLNDASEVNAKEEQSPPEGESHRNHVNPRHAPVSKLMPTDGSLVIFESGRRVFPMKSLQSQPFSDAPPIGEREQAKSKSKDQETPVSVSEDIAEEHLLNRIEPDYPEQAREQHLQGTVILNINVGKDGAVHSLSRVAGDSQLALLAAKAVRQWKFTPLVRDGASVSFESQVTLSFALP
jgi:TonB family protein